MVSIDQKGSVQRELEDDENDKMECLHNNIRFHSKRQIEVEQV